MSAYASIYVAFPLLVVCLALRVPIALSLAISGFVGLLISQGWHTALHVLSSVPKEVVANESFLIIPMFMLMGFLASYGEVAESLIEAVRRWSARLPGGLFIATMFGAAGFGCVTGSSTAATATLGKILLPKMENLKYSRSMAAGSVAIGGTFATLIPPSGLMVVYAILTDVSVRHCLMAGLIPGLLFAIIYSLAIICRVKLNPGLAPARESWTWRERISSLKGVWGMLAIIVLMLGGLYVGVFTPSECGAIGAVGVLVVSLLSRAMSWEKFRRAVSDAIILTAIIMLICVGAFIFARYLIFTRIPIVLSEAIVGAQIPTLGIMGMLALLYLILGLFMEGIGMMVTTIPFILPSLVALDIDLIWYAVFMIMMIEIALVTPPVALNVWVIRGIAPHISLQDIIKGIGFFVGIALINVAIIVVFPQIALFLPSLMR